MSAYKRRFTALLVTTLTFSAVGCSREKRPLEVELPTESGSGSEGLLAWQPLAKPTSTEPMGFDRLSPEQTGIDFAVPIDNGHPQRFLYHSGSFCGGVAIGDVDADGRPDLYLVSGPGKNRLYRQTDDLQFDDITTSARVDGGDAWGTGTAMVDIDGDGDLDIYVCNYDAPNLLYLNDGKGSFTESAAAYGLDIVDASLQPAFADWDRDGDLDMYLLTYRYYFPTGMPRSSPVHQVNGKTKVRPEYQKYFAIYDFGDGKQRFRPVGRPDRMLLNNGDGTFSDVSKEAGISGARYGLSATWWDYDDDGWPDLYVGNDMNDDDRLYHNNGDGTFTDKIAEAVPHSAWFSMGADVADLNGDGLLDFLIADMSATTHFMQKTTMGAMGSGKFEMLQKQPHQYMHNALYLNTGTERFMEGAYLAGLANSDWTWAVKMADFDNDGRNDVLFTNGMTRSFNNSDFKAPSGALNRMSEWDAYEKTEPRREQNLLFQNRGDMRFDDVSKSWGFDHVGVSGPVAVGDLDQDGDLDLIVANIDEPLGVYRNRSAQNHRVVVSLVGNASNRFGIGAKVTLETATQTQVRQAMPWSGFLGSSQPIVHFGLGDQDRITRLTVRWPSGTVQQFNDLASDRKYTITEADSSEPASPKLASPEPRRSLFLPNDRFAQITHRETPFDDFARQPLLPNQLSQLGPGLAFGDIDGDGDDDLYVSGAKGQAGQLLRNNGSGQFTPMADTAWRDDSACEDMAPLFFDADGDGDLDLFVTSGGIECEPGDEVLRDRLYFNDGHGTFQKKVDALPDVRVSGGVVCAADFDRDGDLDLFVGGRSVPGKYPLAPDSMILRNDDGVFTDATDDLCPALRKTGMVTSALWSDADDDGLPDLLVTHEWGPVKLYHNVDGRELKDMTAEAGLAENTGWFNGIAARDIDGDGDIDYVVTNFGLNTKYHATAEKPALLYYGDFDSTGQMRLVEAEFENQTAFPVRGKSCSTNAMPFLANKFGTYKSFALAKLDEVYSPTTLEKAIKFSATSLSSGILINDGKARFQFRALPRVAQISPSFGVVVTEVTGDAFADIYLVQNFFSPQWETGRMDGGVSLLLQGSKDGQFTPVTPADSGLVVPGDAKSLVISDLNADGLPDFVVGVNNAPALSFDRQHESEGQILQVKLQGDAGNPTAIGARVKVYLADGTTQTAEVYAGGGYLSQSSSALYFGRANAQPVDRIEVRWPGQADSPTIVTPSADEQTFTIQQTP